MDNKQFNINGRTKEQLNLAVELLLLDEYGGKKGATGYYFSKEKGLVLTWHINSNKVTAFTNRLGQPEKMYAKELTDTLWKWLDTEEAKSTEKTDWDSDSDHDGSNELGWRLYVDEWGHIKGANGSLDHYSIAAFKPAYLW